MKTELETKIEEYLLNGDGWKMFIKEVEGIENVSASLDSAIDIVTNKENENPCCFDVCFSYKILLDNEEYEYVSKSGKAKYSNKESTGLKIEWIKPLK